MSIVCTAAPYVAPPVAMRPTSVNTQAGQINRTPRHSGYFVQASSVPAPRGQRPCGPFLQVPLTGQPHWPKPWPYPPGRAVELMRPVTAPSVPIRQVVPSSSCSSTAASPAQATRVLLAPTPLRSTNVSPASSHSSAPGQLAAFIPLAVNQHRHMLVVVQPPSIRATNQEPQEKHQVQQTEQRIDEHRNFSRLPEFVPPLFDGQLPVPESPDPTPVHHDAGSAMHLLGAVMQEKNFSEWPHELEDQEGKMPRCASAPLAQTEWLKLEELDDTGTGISMLQASPSPSQNSCATSSPAARGCDKDLATECGDATTASGNSPLAAFDVHHDTHPLLLEQIALMSTAGGEPQCFAAASPFVCSPGNGVADARDEAPVSTKSGGFDWSLAGDETVVGTTNAEAPEKASPKWLGIGVEASHGSTGGCDTPREVTWVPASTVPVGLRLSLPESPGALSEFLSPLPTTSSHAPTPTNARGQCRVIQYVAESGASKSKPKGMPQNLWLKIDDIDNATGPCAAEPSPGSTCSYSSSESGESGHDVRTATPHSPPCASEAPLPDAVPHPSRFGGLCLLSASGKEQETKQSPGAPDMATWVGIGFGGAQGGTGGCGTPREISWVPASLLRSRAPIREGPLVPVTSDEKVP